MGITVRRVEAKDKEAILRISSKIWGGHDYIRFVLDDWVGDKDGYFACAEVDGKVAGFGRYSRITSEYAWLEGLRTDPALQGRGVGKCLTEFFINLGLKESARVLALSTYIDNRASIHIIEKYGFVIAAKFIWAGSRRLKRKAESFKLSPVKGIREVRIREAEDYIRKSNFIKHSKGYLPFGWKFFKVESRLRYILDNASFIIGFFEDSRLEGLACGGEVAKGSDTFSVFFIDGNEVACRNLTKAVLNLKRMYREVEFMIPYPGEAEFPQLEPIKKMRIKNYNQYKPDVFVYEKVLR